MIKNFYVSKNNQIFITIPRQKDHPIKILLELFELNHKKIDFNVITKEKRGVLIEFLKGIRKELSGKTKEEKESE
nr:MAG: hypothetical protein [Lokiarchaeota virus Ratatoskr Meg22_1012]